MAYVFRNTTGGNPGVNRKLTVSEADGNTLESKNRITTLEGLVGKQIDEITSSGTALTVTYTDSTTDGPFPLPVATFNPTGPWLNDTPYAYLDVVLVPSQGTYVCMIAHTSPSPPAEFDPAATEEGSDGSDLLWLQIGEARDVSQDVAFAIMGVLPEVTDSDGRLLGQYIFIHPCIMEAPLNGAESWLETPPESSDGVEIEIRKNSTTAIGTIAWGATDNEGAFDFDNDVNFVAGDRVSLWLMVSDTVPSDETGAADLSVTLPARRTDV